MVDESGALTRLISQEQRIEIWEAYLELGSYSKVAKALNRDRETIARHVKCPEFEQFQSRALEEAGKAALGLLKQYTPSAAEDWKRASSVAADKGDHRPAKELLIVTGAVPTDQVAPQTSFVITTGIDPQGQALPNPFVAFAGRSETPKIEPCQEIDNKVGGVPQLPSARGIEPGKGGESDPEHA